jgi:hypothetical protein
MRHKRAMIVALAVSFLLPAIDGKTLDTTHLLFIHHSCGGQLLADPGPEVGRSRASGDFCIHNLNRKFRDQMSLVLRTKRQNELLPEGQTNAIVVFKSNPVDWLADHRPRDVAVLDYYDVLTNHGSTNWSACSALAGHDSHPSSAGNRRVAEAFVPFPFDTWRTFQVGS